METRQPADLSKVLAFIGSLLALTLLGASVVLLSKDEPLETGPRVAGLVFSSVCITAGAAFASRALRDRSYTDWGVYFLLAAPAVAASVVLGLVPSGNEPRFMIKRCEESAAIHAVFGDYESAIHCYEMILSINPQQKMAVPVGQPIREKLAGTLATAAEKNMESYWAAPERQRSPTLYASAQRYLGRAVTLEPANQDYDGRLRQVTFYLEADNAWQTGNWIGAASFFGRLYCITKTEAPAEMERFVTDVRNRFETALMTWEKTEPSDEIRVRVTVRLDSLRQDNYNCKWDLLDLYNPPPTTAP